MSHEPVVSMRELEMESAELLPGRETLWCCKGGSSHSGGYTNNDFNPQIGLVNINQSSVLSNDNVNILGLFG
jgi:hypothetical protein